MIGACLFWAHAFCVTNCRIPEHLYIVREVKAFRVSSLSSAAEQRRFAMTIV